LFIIEVVTKVELGSVESQLTEGGAFPLDASATNVFRRVIYRVGDDHHAAAIVTDQSRQIFQVITHPERRQL
jgi:hypothetical protein